MEFKAASSVNPRTKQEVETMTIKAFAAEYYYFYFTFFMGKVNFAAMR